MRLALIGIAIAVLLLASAGRSDAEAPPFFVGFTEDLPKEIGADAVEPATDLGASAFRITLMWDPGQTQVKAADTALLDRAVGAADGVRLVLSVYADVATEAPQDAAGRDAYCTYVGNALARYPAIRDVVIWNEPNVNRFWRPRTGAAAAYSALAARCYDVLHAARADVNVVGPVLSPIGWDDASSDSPGAFIRALGDAYRASGRSRPLFDTIAHHGYGNGYGERPWRKHIGLKWISQGDWNKLMYNLWLAFDGTAQPIPGEDGTAIWYLEAGYQTTVEPGHAAAYHGAENEPTVIPAFAGGEPDSPAPSETSIAPDQHTQVVDAIRLAACQPHVGAYFNFLLFDEPTLAGWQSGAFWADRAPKPSHAAFEQAIGEANAGTVACDALKGGRPSADFMPPTAPTGLSATAEWEPLGVRLQWAAATDDLSSITYRVYRDGAHVGTTAETTWTNANVAGATTYTYTVRALDSGGNLGNASAPASVTTPDTTPVILAAGDIASCASTGDEATAALLDGLAGTVAALGDTAYESGTTQEFADCYEPSWGRHKSRTRPAVGDHEYETPGAAGYYAYFGAAAGDPDEGYYSYDLGGWHVVVLNTQCAEIGGCHTGSPQEQWLRAELAAHPADCTLAYMHSPRFSSGSAHGNQAFVEPLWQALYDQGAEVVLAGDDHNYERFAPLTPAGALDTVHGLRSFVVGTGGKSLRPLGTLKPHSQVFDASAFGILELTLRPDGYDWRFVPEAGKTFTDAGSGACHGRPGRTPAEADFDGDGATDVGIWRPATGLWALQGQEWAQFGLDGDIPVPAEYDGDGDTDIAVWRPSSGLWAIRGQPWTSFGTNGDVPVPADYDDDGDDDIAVFQPSTGLWAIKGLPWVQHGANGDVPVPADYDGDGDTDIAIWRPSTGLWAIRGQEWAQFGLDGDIPVPADYDGDGADDIAVFQPSTGLWAVNGQPWVQFGVEGDVPVPADYDGDGDADIAVFRPSTGLWAIRGQAWTQWGLDGDFALPASPAVRLALGG